MSPGAAGDWFQAKLAERSPIRCMQIIFERTGSSSQCVEPVVMSFSGLNDVQKKSIVPIFNFNDFSQRMHRRLTMLSQLYGRSDAQIG